MPRLFLDMDGVLADFDGHYEAVFGHPRRRGSGWADVRTVQDFYFHIPPMPDMLELWEFCAPYTPTVLTGTPSTVSQARNNKHRWVETWLPPGTPIICCSARGKSMFMKPGDVIVDDHDEYRHLWEEKGGIWVLHTSAKDSIKQLKKILAIIPAG